MLKTLNNNDTLVTPYVNLKNWNLSNNNNEDIVLAENGNSIAAESLIYHSLYIETSSLCSVAKENQSNDLAKYKEGTNIDGLFYPDTDPKNLDGTYKRIVFNQFKTIFYNNHKDPSKVWGSEKIDIDTSEVKKFISDSIKILDIPTDIMGEGMVKNSIVLTDNSIEDNYVISDDGNCNLFAGNNLFSKIQVLGDFKNLYVEGTDSVCDEYFTY